MLVAQNFKDLGEHLSRNNAMSVNNIAWQHTNHPITDCNRWAIESRTGMTIAVPRQWDN